MSPRQVLEERLSLCQTRVAASDARYKAAGDLGDKLNAYYHGGEVASLHFALAVFPTPSGDTDR